MLWGWLLETISSLSSEWYAQTAEGPCGEETRWWQGQVLPSIGAGDRPKDFRWKCSRVHLHLCGMTGPATLG